MTSQNDPFSLLLALDRRSRANAAGLPAQDEAIEHWNGIGFALGDIRCVAAMGDVVEILHLPRFTPIPGVRNWMQGVANVRGRLLPIMDLNLFLGLDHKRRTPRDRRVLVVDREDVFSGLIVDAVLGMQYFQADTLHTEVAEAAPGIRNFVKGFYPRGDQRWFVFDVEALISHPDFSNVARQSAQTQKGGEPSK